MPAIKVNVLRRSLTKSYREMPLPTFCYAFLNWPITSLTSCLVKPGYSLALESSSKFCPLLRLAIPNEVFKYKVVRQKT